MERSTVGALRGCVRCPVLVVAVTEAGLPGSGASDTEVVAYYEDGDTELERELGGTLVGFAVFLLRSRSPREKVPGPPVAMRAGGLEPPRASRPNGT